MKDRVLGTDLYCITDEGLSKGRDNIEVVNELLRADIKIIQYRAKNKSMKGKYEECRKIRKLTAERGVTFIVNDHIDLALAVEADGVHIGQGDLPIEVVRRLIGDKMIIGLSTHSPEEIENGVRAGADYLGIGPVFSTSTKEDASPPLGLDYLRDVADKIKIPFVVIGGITEANIGSVRESGAECICLISEIVGAEDIGEKIRGLRKCLEKK
ncbi:thiamine phosphate synthase [Iocasia frigidifontis]|uniref:Thiamine-phosphate synthase n=1 Tax=Iocasia fonsfrigidae TaxID=2682810 RepID=A0A8A7KDE0_9FIRM|nr:thiamine phosphate synthase [Iocasia fonsfrigidae]